MMCLLPACLAILFLMRPWILEEMRDLLREDTEIKALELAPVGLGQM
jgi:hypothetical protein